MAGRLEGRVCVITGAASGIGAATARVFREEGARVAGIDLRDDFEGVDLAIAASVASGSKPGRSTMSAPAPSASRA